MVSEITASELRDRLDAGDEFVLLDTRDTESFEGWRIPGSVQYFYKPFHEFDLDALVSATEMEKDDEIITICAKGKASYAIAEELESAGYNDVTVVLEGMRAWSAVYDHVPIELADDLTIVQIQRRAKGCLGYVIASNGEAAVIDATRHTDEFTTAADALGTPITAVFDTHIHADHISGGRSLATALDVPYYMGHEAAGRDVTHAFEPLAPNDVVEVGGVDIKALATPGHTSDMVSYLIDTEAVITGDTLFVESVGRTELQFGDGEAQTGATQLYDSLHRTLLAEPDSVTVLPGHFTIRNDGTSPATPGEPIVTTIGETRVGLDILSADRDDFVERITARLPEKPPNYETVIGINQGSTTVENETDAIELELGPNRCAAETDAGAD
ncbi:MBL fold metallo-hydrolase [Halorubraceae archaeon YAN]|nr:MBL fold metallo-hydrolase [Halorubraceae archaeon YAN]